MARPRDRPEGSSRRSREGELEPPEMLEFRNLRRRRHLRQLSQASDRWSSLLHDEALHSLSTSASASTSSSSPPSVTRSHSDLSELSSSSGISPPSPTSLSASRHAHFTQMLGSITRDMDMNRHVDPLESFTSAAPSSPFSIAGRSEGDGDTIFQSLIDIRDESNRLRTTLQGDLSTPERHIVEARIESFLAERRAIEIMLFNAVREQREQREQGNSISQSEASRPSPLVRLHLERQQLFSRTPGTGNAGSRSTTGSDSARPALELPSDYRGPSFDELKPSAAFLYSVEPAPTGSDVWPDVRDPSKVPAKYMPIDLAAGSRHKHDNRSKATRGDEFTSIESIDWMNEEDHRPTWPQGQLPSEIYYLITDKLSRDDVKAMRLTCREFEHHVSCILFRTVVVPFNTEIYGMLQGVQNGKVDTKGKGKMKGVAPDPVKFWKNPKAEDIYTGSGIDVFKSFGPRLKRFGMSFEVDEDALANPPLKGIRQAHKSYWGEYTWPYPEYQRFKQVAGLEDAADETPKMKIAFSLLGEVQELALSLDSGLGWISGPDQSLHSRVLRKQNPVFGTEHVVLERKIQAQRDLWEFFKRSFNEVGGSDLRHSAIYHRRLSPHRAVFEEIRAHFVAEHDSPETPYIDIHPLYDPTLTQMLGMWPLEPRGDGPPGTSLLSLDSMDEQLDRLIPVRPEPPVGIMMVREDKYPDPERFEKYPIVPSNLSKLQKEWLLETEWAQRAFLSSYLVAIVDNPNAFQNVHTMNFARISSRFLLSLARNDLWDALPNLKSVNMQVIADWRDVTKDNAGFVETPRVNLSSATYAFGRLLADMIAPRRNIKALNIGWACGGEHAKGLYARNKLLMPIPVIHPEWVSSVENMANTRLYDQRMIVFEHLEELTLTNCWMPPEALTILVRKHQNLVKLTLDSVSLSAPLVLNNNNNNNAGMPPQVIAPAPNAVPAWHTLPPPAVPANNQNPTAQLQQLLAWVPPAPAQPPAPHAQLLQPLTWTGPHRVGSWPHVIDTISPGTTLASHGSGSSPENIVISSPACKLKELAFKSCGYCRLHISRFDESVIQMPTTWSAGAWFTKRYAALSKVMMSAKGFAVAEIVQHLPRYEEEALETVWGCVLGWPWADEIEREGPTYDGWLPGGSGRFSGRVGVESRAVTEDED